MNCQHPNKSRFCWYKTGVISICQHNVCCRNQFFLGPCKVICIYQIIIYRIDGRKRAFHVSPIILNNGQCVAIKITVSFQDKASLPKPTLFEVRIREAFVKMRPFNWPNFLLQILSDNQLKISTHRERFCKKAF